MDGYARASRSKDGGICAVRRRGRLFRASSPARYSYTKRPGSRGTGAALRETKLERGSTHPDARIRAIRLRTGIISASRVAENRKISRSTASLPFGRARARTGSPAAAARRGRWRGTASSGGGRGGGATRRWTRASVTLTRGAPTPPRSRPRRRRHAQIDASPRILAQSREWPRRPRRTPLPRPRSSPPPTETGHTVVFVFLFWNTALLGFAVPSSKLMTYASAEVLTSYLGEPPNIDSHMWNPEVSNGRRCACGGRGALLCVTVRLPEVAVLGVALGGGRTYAEPVIRAPARLVPRVAVGRLDGHSLNLPFVSGAVRAAVVVLAPLPDVVVALVEAPLLDEELLASARELPAPVHGVVVGVQVAFLGIADSVGRKRRGEATSATNARGFGGMRRKNRSGRVRLGFAQTHTSRHVPSLVTRFRVGKIESVVRSRDVP